MTEMFLPWETSVKVLCATAPSHAPGRCGSTTSGASLEAAHFSWESSAPHSPLNALSVLLKLSRAKRDAWAHGRGWEFWGVTRSPPCPTGPCGQACSPRTSLCFVIDPFFGLKASIKGHNQHQSRALVRKSKRETALMVTINTFNPLQTHSYFSIYGKRTFPTPSRNLRIVTASPSSAQPEFLWTAKTRDINHNYCSISCCQIWPPGCFLLETNTGISSILLCIWTINSTFTFICTLIYSCLFFFFLWVGQAVTRELLWFNVKFSLFLQGREAHR